VNAMGGVEMLMSVHGNTWHVRGTHGHFSGYE
jgi:hypothetical protein